MQNLGYEITSCSGSAGGESSQDIKSNLALGFVLASVLKALHGHAPVVSSAAFVYVIDRDDQASVWANPFVTHTLARSSPWV